MSPVAKSIRKAFEEKQRTYRKHSYESIPVCSRAAFDLDDFWMNHYLFPEIIDNSGLWTPNPCQHFTTETILRIMVEAGIID
jgi:hypothetical protein